MQAVTVHKFGGPEELVIETRPDPQPEGDEVLVAITAAGVCRHDLLTRAGAFTRVKPPIVPGHQITGRVIGKGPDVTDLTVGQRVLCTGHESCGVCRYCREGYSRLCEAGAKMIGDDLDGGYADRILASHRAFIPLPDTVSDLEGCVVMCTFGTGFHALITRGQAHLGETVLITGATGGVGSHTLQIAKAMGLRTICTTRSEEKAETLRELGADYAVVADESRYAHKVKDLTGGLGADLVLELVGSATLIDSVHSVRPGGRIVVIGNVNGQPVDFSPAYLILKEISLVGTKGASNAELASVLQMVGNGTLHSRINVTLPLAEAAQAHRMMEANDSASSFGRVVLLPPEH